MFEKIVARDKKLFLKINCFPHPRPLTWFFVFIDLLTLWGVVFATISLYLIIFGNLRQKEFGILGIYVILMTILINEVFLKKLFFKRERPHRGLNNVKLFWLTPRTGSFPSGQTTNIFSWTIFFSLSKPLNFIYGFGFWIFDWF